MLELLDLQGDFAKHLNMLAEGDRHEICYKKAIVDEGRLNGIRYVHSHAINQENVFHQRTLFLLHEKKKIFVEEQGPLLQLPEIFSDIFLKVGIVTGLSKPESPLGEADNRTEAILAIEIHQGMSSFIRSQSSFTIRYLILIDRIAILIIMHPLYQELLSVVQLVFFVIVFRDFGQFLGKNRLSGGNRSLSCG